jgi:ribosomal protein S27AE
MIIKTKEHFIGKDDRGHGYEHYDSEAICSNCGKHLADLKRYPPYEAQGLDKDWKFCPYCGDSLYKNK